MEHLYTKLSVPLKLFDFNRFCENWKHCFRKRLGLYGLSTDENVMREYLKRIQLRKDIDFGELSEDLQMQVIRAVKDSSHDRDELMELNPFLERGCVAGDWKDLITCNRAIIAREYSVQKNRERLLKMYA